MASPNYEEINNLEHLERQGSCLSELLEILGIEPYQIIEYILREEQFETVVRILYKKYQTLPIQDCRLSVIGGFLCTYPIHAIAKKVKENREDIEKNREIVEELFFRLRTTFLEGISSNKTQKEISNCMVEIVETTLQMLEGLLTLKNQEPKKLEKSIVDWDRCDSILVTFLSRLKGVELEKFRIYVALHYIAFKRFSKNNFLWKQVDFADVINSDRAWACQLLRKFSDILITLIKRDDMWDPSISLKDKKDEILQEFIFQIIKKNKYKYKEIKQYIKERK